MGLQTVGHQIVDEAGQPDIWVINTCAVTSKADQQSKHTIQKALRSGTMVIVTGCYAELNYDSLKKRAEKITLVKNKEKHSVVSMIPHDSLSPLSFVQHNSRHRPIIKIQDGCDYACSYCTVPLARGRSRSVPKDQIIERLNFYASLGYNEVVLSGIHLGTYGLDLTPEVSLSLLLEEILSKTSIPRIRISSIESREVDEKLLELFHDPRLCQHLHVPLQSGDDTILRLMNRSYTVKDYVSCLERVWKTFPSLSVGTDIIVGFPRENEIAFLNTRKLLQSLPFSYLHVFPYSSRPGTKASQVLSAFPTAEDTKARVKGLHEIAFAKKEAYIKRFLGTTLDVLIEGEGLEGCRGTTRNYIKVILMGVRGLKNGTLVDTHISQVKKGAALGAPVNSSEPLNK